MLRCGNHYYSEVIARVSYNTSMTLFYEGVYVFFEMISLLESFPHSKPETEVLEILLTKVLFLGNSLFHGGLRRIPSVKACTGRRI